MNKMDRIILSIDNTTIFNNSSFFRGFKKDETIFKNILNNLQWLRRGDAEVDFTRKQPIWYWVLYNPDIDSFYLYKREDNTKNGKNGETRLNNKYSLGLGGHIEKQDIKNIKRNVLEDSLLREVEEEVGMNGTIKGTKFVGLINSDATEVDDVHIGVLYIIETDATEAKPKDGEIAFWNFVKKKDILKAVREDNGELEEWSRIILQTL